MDDDEEEASEQTVGQDEKGERERRNTAAWAGGKGVLKHEIGPLRIYRSSISPLFTFSPPARFIVFARFIFSPCPSSLPTAFHSSRSSRRKFSRAVIPAYNALARARARAGYFFLLFC